MNENEITVTLTTAPLVLVVPKIESVTITVPVAVARALLDVAGYCGDVAKALTEDERGKSSYNKRYIHNRSYSDLHTALASLYSPLSAIRGSIGYREHQV